MSKIVSDVTLRLDEETYALLVSEVVNTRIPMDDLISRIVTFYLFEYVR